MAEERVVLQVKFEEAIGRHVAARAAGGTASSAFGSNRERVGGLGSSSTVPVAAEIVSDFKSETRARASDLFDRLKDSKERIAAAKSAAVATRTANIPAVGGIVRAAGGPIAIAAAGTALALAAVGTSAYAFSVQLKKATESAKQLSGAVIRAAAIGERDVFFARLRQARQLAPELARSVRARSQADVALIELQTVFVNELMPVVLPFIEAASDGLVVFAKLAKTLSESTVVDTVRDTGFEIQKHFIKNTSVTGSILVKLVEMLAAWRKDKRDAMADEDQSEFESELDDFLDPDNWNRETRGFARPNR